MINQIITGDNIAILRGMDDLSVDLTVTSPPYDGLRTYNGYSFDFENVAKELFRVTKEGGVVVWVVNDSTIKGSESGTSFKQALFFKEIGFRLHDTMIYHKNNPTPMRGNRYQQSFEYMFILTKGAPKTFNPLTTPKKYMEDRKAKQYNKRTDGTQIVREYKAESTDRTIRNVWSYSVGLHHTTKDREAFEHPAIFPERLAEDHILSWSNPGDVILDPFGGSGTTAKMAKLNGRDFIHIDVSEEYNDIARRRITDVTER